MSPLPSIMQSRKVVQLASIAGVALLIFAVHDSGQASTAEVPRLTRDVYFQNEAIPTGPRAPRLYVTDYPARGGDSRLTIWIVAQQHVYWGGLVLGTLFLVTGLEILSLLGTNQSSWSTLDDFAREILQLILLGLSITAVLGGIFLFSLLLLYPDLTTYLLGLFRPLVLVYGTLALLLTFFTYAYFYTWDSMRGLGAQYIHAAVGVLVNVIGCTIVLIANGWASFMMSPAGVDERGQYLGNIWHVLHTATWNPTNVHRLASHLVLGAAVVAAYAAYRAWASTDRDEKVTLDAKSYRWFALMTCALFVLPFAGYWLMREIYAYSQQMGITQLGGLLAWLNVVRVTLVGALFLGINSYLWQRINVAAGGYRHSGYAKYVFLILALCYGVYITPHTMVMTPLELKQMGGQQHQVLGNYGVESAKSAAINLMIVMTVWTWCVVRISRQTTSAFRGWSRHRYLAPVFLVGALNILWLGIYGYYLPANVRIGLSVVMISTSLSLLVLGMVLTRADNTEAQGADAGYGQISVRGYFALFGLAFIVTWLAGLGGYTRSALRLFWHVHETVKDASPWHFTPTAGFAANVITLNALLFWATLAFILWLSSKSLSRAVSPAPRQTPSPSAIEPGEQRT